MRITYNKILLFLVYIYVFLAPFEDILLFLYNIDTVFKPYRIVGLVILIMGFFYRYPRKPLVVFGGDKFAVFLFAYGFLYTLLLSAIGANVNIGAFSNTMIQITFMVLIHLTLKRIDITYKQLDKILTFLVIGIAINAAIIVMDFYVFALSAREKGMSDNSNYAAMQMAIAAVICLYRVQRNNYRIFSLKNLINVFLYCFLFFAILATGSRTGFLIIAVCTFTITMLLSNWKSRIQLIPYAGILVIGLAFTPFVQNLIEQTTTFNRLENASEDIRVPLFKAGVNAIKDSYGMGIGVAQMIDKQNFKKYMMPVMPNWAVEIDKRGKGLGLHNMYLEITVETGFIGLTAFMLFLYFIWRYQMRMFRRSPYRSIHGLIATLFLSVVLMGLTGKGLLGALFWLMYTLASIYYLPDKEEETPPPSIT